MPAKKAIQVRTWLQLVGEKNKFCTTREKCYWHKAIAGHIDFLFVFICCFRSAIATPSVFCVIFHPTRKMTEPHIWYYYRCAICWDVIIYLRLEILRKRYCMVNISCKVHTYAKYLHPSLCMHSMTESANMKPMCLLKYSTIIHCISVDGNLKKVWAISSMGIIQLVVYGKYRPFFQVFYLCLAILHSVLRLNNGILKYIKHFDEMIVVLKWKTF